MNEIIAKRMMLLRMWSQRIRNWELIKVDVPGNPQKGPEDEYLHVMGMKVFPDKQGNFTHSAYRELEIDAVHAFTAARLTIDLWERALAKKISWRWSNRIFKRKLRIVLYDPLISGEYQSEYRSISFGSYGTESLLTCRSFDIVSHETTHAIIDSFGKRVQLGPVFKKLAKVEEICDLCPMLIAFSTPVLLSKAIEECGGDFNKPNLISEFAEGYGVDSISGIRSALSPGFSLNEQEEEKQFIPIIYNYMVALYNSTKSQADMNARLSACCTYIIKKLFDPGISTLESYYKIIEKRCISLSASPNKV